MPPRFLAVALGAAALASIAAAGPDLPPPPEVPEVVVPVPNGVCVYARPVNPDRKYCVVLPGGE